MADSDVIYYYSPSPPARWPGAGVTTGYVVIAHDGGETWARTAVMLTDDKGNATVILDGEDTAG